MRSLSITAGSGLAAAAAVYFAVAAFQNDDGLLAPGVAVFTVLVTVLLLAVNQAYLAMRSLGYATGQLDAGRAWVARRRELVGGPMFSGGKTAIAKRFVFLATGLALNSRTIVLGSVVAVFAVVGILIAGAADAELGTTAALLVALIPFAFVIIATVAGRTVLGAVLFSDGRQAVRSIVGLGRLPVNRPALRSMRALRPHKVAGHLADIIPVVIVLVAVAAPVMAAVGLAGVELAIVVGLLLVHLAATNLALFQTSREWWRQLARTNPTREPTEVVFARGTLPPTPRVMVDIVTPIGPRSPIHELGGVLSDHRSLVGASVRWTVVTDPGRVDEVNAYLASLFQMHGAPAGAARARAIACDEPKPGPKRNLGARAATAPFVTFIDADDRVDLQRLIAAVNTALTRSRALQSVHLFPFHLLTASGVQLKAPDANYIAAITHHHCARLWPTGIFRAGLAEYGNVDFEDAIFILDMASKLDLCQHTHVDTAFLTYADHRQEPTRLTRAYKDSSLLLRRLAEDAVGEVEAFRVPKPTARERALIDVFVGRVSAEVAWQHGPILEGLRTSLRAFAPYREARRDLEVSAEQIAQSINGVRSRSRSDLHGGFDRGLVAFLRDELSAKVPCSITLTAAGVDPVATQAFDERQLGLLVGLMNADTRAFRNQSAAPTVYYNLDGDGYLRSRRAMPYFCRATHFKLEVDPSLPVGTVEVLDPATKSRQHLGSFAEDRLMSSKLLRLWDRFYPSVNQVEQARAHIVLQSLGLRSEASVVRLVGTGPSSGASTELSSGGPGVVTICCNSWARQPQRMAQMGAKILTAGDPIFHAGPSEYARQFRADVASWLRSDPEHLFITVSRDISIYLAELPLDVHDQVIAPVLDAVIDTDHPVMVETGRVQPYPNIMTLLMLPMAELMDPDELHLFGFDGGARGAEEYWKYDPEVNYSEDLQQTVREWHPEFFRVDYQQYRDDHDEHVKGWIERFEAQGVAVRAAAPSNVSAVDAVYRANLETVEIDR